MANSKIVANVRRLNKLMDENGCSAVVARSGKNFTYLAGFAYPGTLARHLDFPDSPRGVLVIWPRRGDPVLIVNEIAAPLARRDSWVKNVQVYDGYAESPYSRTADILKEMGLEGEKNWPGERLPKCPAVGGAYLATAQGRPHGLH
jgi:Xaa-Pro aminopeptidase